MESWLLVNVPTVWLGTGIVAVFVVVSLGGLVLVRRSIDVSKLAAHHDVAGFILAVVGVVYAVLLAFVVVTVWQHYDAAKSNADQEAVSVESVYRDALALAHLRPDLPPAVRAYAVSVADVEWPEMAIDHRSSSETNQAINRVWHDLVVTRPRSDADSDFYSDALTLLHNAAELRQIRILSSGDELPTVLWVVLIAAGFITIAFTYFFAVSEFGLQALMVSGLAVSIGLVLFLVLSLDLPFTGGTAVGRDSMEAAVQHFADESVTLP